jgi:hypothetical protein
MLSENNYSLFSRNILYAGESCRFVNLMRNIPVK